jgi:septum formation protein
MLNHLKDRHIILASRSPRRRFLLKQMGLAFTAIHAEIDENYPDGMDPDDIAIFLAEKKAKHFEDLLGHKNNIIITADTLVVIDGHIIGKPDDMEGAREMLKRISGRMHQVVTGVTIRNFEKSVTFTDWTSVYFKSLTEEEIHYYLERFVPLDKAGAYGVQEWIGYIGVQRIDGSYYNVMGLPVQRLYEELSKF